MIQYLFLYDHICETSQIIFKFQIFSSLFFILNCTIQIQKYVYSQTQFLC